jgi:nucleoside-diphosphate-sugar epimerase
MKTLPGVHLMQGCVSFWSGRRVLVNGCTGFLGAAVTRELFDRGAQVVSVLQEKKSAERFALEHEAGYFRIVRGRADDASCIYSALAIHEVSTIFHIADDTEGSDASTDADLNATMRAALLYHPKLPVVAARPNTKLRILGSGANLPHGIARFGELFGPGDKSMSHLVPRTIAGLLSGERNLSFTNACHDFVFARDAASACLTLAEEVGDGSKRFDIDFRSGWALTESDMVSLIGDLVAGRQLEASGQFELPFNPVGWQPSKSLNASLGETIEWYRTRVRHGASTRPIDSTRKAA